MVNTSHMNTYKCLIVDKAELTVAFEQNNSVDLPFVFAFFSLKKKHLSNLSVLILTFKSSIGNAAAGGRESTSTTDATTTASAKAASTSHGIYGTTQKPSQPRTATTTEDTIQC